MCNSTFYECDLDVLSLSWLSWPAFQCHNRFMLTCLPEIPHAACSITPAQVTDVKCPVTGEFVTSKLGSASKVRYLVNYADNDYVFAASMPL